MSPDESMLDAPISVIVLTPTRDEYSALATIVTDRATSRRFPPIELAQIHSASGQKTIGLACIGGQGPQAAEGRTRSLINAIEPTPNLFILSGIAGARHDADCYLWDAIIAADALDFSVSERKPDGSTWPTSKAVNLPLGTQEFISRLPMWEQRLVRKAKSISDVIGYKKTGESTRYAAHVAGAVVRSLLEDESFWLWLDDMQAGQRSAPTGRGDHAQNHKAKSENKVTESATQLEEAICLKAESDFRIKRMKLRNSPMPVEMRTRLDENIQREYRPFSVMVQSKTIQVEEYLLPLIRERISLEAQLRRTQNRPFTAERIRSIKSEMEKLVLDEWPSIVNEGYADAVRHVHRLFPRVAHPITKFENCRRAASISVKSGPRSS